MLAPLGADTTGSQFLEPDGTFPNHIPNPENKDAMEAIKENCDSWHLGEDYLDHLEGQDIVLKAPGIMPSLPQIVAAKEAGCEAVILESHRNWIEKSPVKSFQLSAKYLNERV